MPIQPDAPRPEQPPQGVAAHTARHPGHTSFDEGTYVFRVLLLAGPALVLVWRVARLSVPIIAAIPMVYLVGQGWCAWAYHRGRSPRIIMVANYVSILAGIFPLIPVVILLLHPSSAAVVWGYVWHLPLLARLAVVWILLELPVEIVFSLFYARQCRRRLVFMAQAAAEATAATEAESAQSETAGHTRC